MPIVFTGLVAVGSILRPGYSQIAKEVSDLGVGPYSGIMNANFILCGVLGIIFALGVGAAISSSDRQAGRRVQLALEVFGAGVILAGVTLVLSGAMVGSFVIPEIPAYYAHTTASLIAFLAIIVAQFLTWRAVKGSERGVWGRYARYSLFSGAVSIVLLSVFLSTSFGPYQGLTERMFIAVQLVWVEVMALKLRSLTPKSPRPSDGNREISVILNTYHVRLMSSHVQHE
jgi:hypothetical membrane protein